MSRVSRIDWCDSTWNPITGCMHGCRYCYARSMAHRFGGDIRLNKMSKADYKTVPGRNGTQLYELDKPMLNENGSIISYPFGFEPTLHRYKVSTLDQLKMGRNIFVGSMADVFGEWVPDEWINFVIEECKKRGRNNYLFLTKNPDRYLELIDKGMLPARDNFWYGTTVTKNSDPFPFIDGYHLFLSIEPLLEPMGKPGNLDSEDSLAGIEWVIIGAETGKRKGKVIPKREWIDEITEACDALGIPVFMKKSLIPIMGEDMRQEYPEQLIGRAPSRKKELLQWDYCMGCGKHDKKMHMATITARVGRDQQSNVVGFMCRQCLEDFCTDRGVDIPELAWDFDKKGV